MQKTSVATSGTVTDKVIQGAVSEAKAEIRQRNVEKLTTDQRILYEIITECDEIEPGELYEAYQARADNPSFYTLVDARLRSTLHQHSVAVLIQRNSSW